MNIESKRLLIKHRSYHSNQGIYLVNIGWNEGAIGIALSLMGFTALICQTFAGDIIDKTTVDRRKLLSIAAILTAASAMAVLFVHEGNQDHMLMYITKIVEGIASSFIGPCIAALTLASFGPDEFDSIMANNVSCVAYIRVLYGMVHYPINIQGKMNNSTSNLIRHFRVYGVILEVQYQQFWQEQQHIISIPTSNTASSSLALRHYVQWSL